MTWVVAASSIFGYGVMPPCAITGEEIFREDLNSQHRRHSPARCSCRVVLPVHDAPLSGGNYATIFSAGTWLTETALAGWGGRTRTCKCHFEKTIEMLGEFSLDYEAFGGQRLFACELLAD
jgi:hypothetical protein